MIPTEPSWIYLDDETEREQLAQAIRAIRQRVWSAVHSRHEFAHEPRYGGWSLAGLLAHLNANDTLGRWQIQAALVGIRPRFSAGRLHRLNDWQRRFFQHTPLEKTLAQIEQHCERLSEFIHTLPLGKLSTRVWLLETQEWTTVERATQIYFLHHWQRHLQQIETQSGAPQASTPQATPPQSPGSEA